MTPTPRHTPGPREYLSDAQVRQLVAQVRERIRGRGGALPQAPVTPPSPEAQAVPSKVFEEVISENRKYQEVFYTLGILINVLQNNDLCKKLKIERGNIIRGLKSLTQESLGREIDSEELDSILTSPLRPRMIIHERILNLTNERDKSVIRGKLEAIADLYADLKSPEADLLMREGYKVLNELETGKELKDIKVEAAKTGDVFSEEIMKEKRSNTEKVLNPPEPPIAETQGGIDYNALLVEMDDKPEMLILNNFWSAFQCKTREEFEAYQNYYFNGDTLPTVIKKISDAMGDLSFGAAFFQVMRSDQPVEALGKLLKASNQNDLKAKLAEFYQRMVQLYPNLNQ